MTFPGPSNHCSCNCVINNSTILSCQTLQDSGEHDNTNGSPDCETLLYFYDCELCSLVRTNTVWWNTMIVNKAFCTSMDGSLDRSTMCTKDKFITHISIYSNKDNAHCPFPRWKQFSVVHALPGQYLTNLGWCISETQYWFLWLTEMTLRRSLDGQKYALVSP